MCVTPAVHAGMRQTWTNLLMFVWFAKQPRKGKDRSDKGTTCKDGRTHVDGRNTSPPECNCSRSLQARSGRIFQSKLDGSCCVIVISRPLNWLCLKHISGSDCGNWGLSRPNSHVIPTGTVSLQNAHHPPFLVQMHLPSCHSLQAWNPI